MKPLQLYVLCGPNGAGKSTLSESFVPPGTDVFDGDKEMSILKDQYPMTDSGTLYEAANDVIFQRRKENAIAQGNDFAFETNFRTAQVMESVKQFRDAGYETRMIFIGLPSIEASVNRVNMRVKAGGHFVDTENVNKNFTGGLENLEKFYDQFDSADIFESSIDQNEPFKVAALMTIKDGVLVAKADKLPDWAIKIPQEIERKLQQKIQDKLSNRKHLGKGIDRDNDRGLGMGR